MQVVKLIQGSPEWHAHRATHFNASDAPAMLGCSPYTSRGELVRQLATGYKTEVDEATQKIFDDGHRFEALARPVAERLTDLDFYPQVGVEGRYSASFDGLTLDRRTAFEHKSLNKTLREVMVEGCTGADLPMVYRVQMEHQSMVAGCERILFMASKWNGDELVEERHCWYTPDPELRAQIVEGWALLEQDVAAYTPPEQVDAVIPEQTESLPALVVRVDGQLAIQSNLDKFTAMLRGFIDKIEMKPSTDQDFAAAEAAVKTLKKAEDALEQALQSGMNQTASIEELSRSITDQKEFARVTRLALEKAVKARKEQIRAEVLLEGSTALAQHIAALNTKLGRPYMPAVRADFESAIKGKKTVDGLRDGMKAELARAQAEATTIANRITANLQALRSKAGQHAFLFADAAALVLKDPEAVAAIIEQRLAEHAAKEEARLVAERERIRREEAERLERERVAAERAAAAQAQAAKEPTLEPEQKAAPAAAPITTAPTTPAQVDGIVDAEIDPAATIKLGQINALLGEGLTVTATFIEGLGIHPTGKERTAILYRERDVPVIFERLITHLQQARREFFEQAMATA